MRIYTAKDIYEAFKDCISDSEDYVMHLSFKAIGNTENGFEDLYRAICNRGSGTAIYPAFSFDTVNDGNPFFDKDETPVCVGKFPDWFSKCENVHRSIHPTHSLSAIGQNAEFYISGHENDITPCGENSPLMKLTEKGGKILMLGCGLRPNTTMHGIEEAVGTPYVLENEKTLYHISDGDNKYEKEYYNHCFINSEGQHYVQRYDRIENIIKVEKKSFLDTYVYIINADELREKAGAAIKKNPFYFVD